MLLKIKSTSRILQLKYNMKILSSPRRSNMSEHIGDREWTRQVRFLILWSWHSWARVSKLQAASPIYSLCLCQLSRCPCPGWPWKPHVKMASLSLGPYVAERRQRHPHPEWKVKFHWDRDTPTMIEKQNSIELSCLHFSSMDTHTQGFGWWLIQDAWCILYTEEEEKQQVTGLGIEWWTCTKHWSP